MFGHYAWRNSFILQSIHGFTRAPTLIMKINRKVNRVTGVCLSTNSKDEQHPLDIGLPAVRVSGQTLQCKYSWRHSGDASG